MMIKDSFNGRIKKLSYSYFAIVFSPSLHKKEMLERKYNDDNDDDGDFSEFSQ